MGAEATIQNDDAVAGKVPIESGPLVRDADLVALARGGDRDALGRFVERYLGQVFDFAIRSLRDRNAAIALTRGTIVEALAEFTSPSRSATAVSAAGEVFGIARVLVMKWLEASGTLSTAIEIPADEARRSVFEGHEPGWALSATQAQSEREAAAIAWRAAAELPAWQYVVLDIATRHRLDATDLSIALNAPATVVHDLVESIAADLDARARHHLSATIGVGRSPRDLFSILAPVGLPIELRNGIQREVIANWPDSVRSGPPELPPPLAPTSPGRDEPRSEEGPAPSQYVGSRAAHDLLERTRGQRLDSEAESRRAEDETRARLDESAQAPITIDRPVPLRGFDGGELFSRLVVGLIVIAMLLVGILVGLVVAGVLTPDSLRETLFGG
ncbi:MAG: hypothetical protein EPO26_13230 [Chloroflexota bacterium]|nr:MAG: hypothetical protein EPO26_13230 [Chloroflexota bacterium]